MGPICPKCNLGTWVEIGGGVFQEQTEGFPVYHPNIEAREGATVDIVCDLEVNDIPLHNGHAERIKMMHFLQHLPIQRARYILKDCYRVLRKGGSLFIMVGDMENVFSQALKEGLTPHCAGCIWGEQEHQYDFHKWGYTVNSLIEELKNAGYTNIAYQGHYNPWEFSIRCVKP